MIKKTRRKLVWGYTLAIIAILIISSLSGILALNYYTSKAMQNSLLPELESETAEARPILREWLHNPEPEPDIVHFESYDLAFTVMEYWFSSKGELVMAEGTRDISNILMDLIHDWGYPNLEIGEIEFTDDNGKEWIFIVIANDVYDDDGAYLGKVVVGTNMTPLVRITRQYFVTAVIIIVLVSILAYFVGNYFAARAIEPINLTMQKQRNFVADASHELRTPLSVMLASVDMLESSSANEQIIADMRSEIINMRNLVASLLTMARSDNDKDVAHFADFDLCEVARAVARGLQHLASAKNIKIVHNLDKPVVFHGDEIKLRQLFNILLDNAVKYSQPNMVVVFDIEQKHGHITINVTDYGAGIAVEDQVNIFERFYRADKARSREQGGFGLGLAIAKLIAETHGGDIKVKSEPGRGSTFTVTLPVRPLLPFKNKPI